MDTPAIDDPSSMSLPQVPWTVQTRPRMATNTFSRTILFCCFPWPRGSTVPFDVPWRDTMETNVAPPPLMR